MDDINTLKTQLVDIQADIKKHEDILEGLRGDEEKIIQTIEKMKADERQKAKETEITKITKIDVNKKPNFGLEEGKTYTFKVVEGFNPGLTNKEGVKLNQEWTWGDSPIIRCGTIIKGEITEIGDIKEWIDFFKEYKNYHYLRLKNVEIDGQNLFRYHTIMNMTIPVDVLEHTNEKDRNKIHPLTNEFTRTTGHKLDSCMNKASFDHLFKMFGKENNYMNRLINKTLCFEVGNTYKVELNDGRSFDGQVSDKSSYGEIIFRTKDGRDIKVYVDWNENSNHSYIVSATRIGDLFMFRSYKKHKNLKKTKKSAKIISKKTKKSAKKMKKSIRNNKK